MSSLGITYRNLMTGLHTHSHNLARLQEQISSGIAIQRSSDAPADAHQISSLLSQGESLDSYISNLDHVLANLEQSSSVLQECSGLLIDVRQLVTQAASDTYSPAQRLTMGEGIDALLEQIFTLSNTEVADQYLFGGDGSGTTPFVAERTDGRIASVTYQGSTAVQRVPVSPGVEYTASLVGDDVFRSDNRQAPTFFGDTGAAAGTGTSSIQGDALLTITHDTTTYDPGPGTQLAAGTSSAASDTIIGESHTIYLDADNDQIKLDDGVYVSFPTGGDDADIMLTNSAGEVVYVDVTNLAGGLEGVIEVDLTATGELSLDGGVTTTDLDSFDANVLVTDSDGRALYIDATGIIRTGEEPIRVGGTHDVFSLLIGVRDILLNTSGLTESQQSALLTDATDSLQEIMDEVSQGQIVTGGRTQAMGSLRDSLTRVRADLDVRRAALQDADLIELATELARTQAFYEMLLGATARAIDLSLMDYL